MAALWIFAVLAVLLLLLCLIRVGVLVRFGNELIVTVRLGVFRFQVFPEKKRGKAKAEAKAAAERKREETSVSKADVFRCARGGGCLVAQHKKSIGAQPPGDSY